MNKTLRNKRRQWRSTLVGEQQMEVLSIPFEGFSGKIEHCRLIVQRQRKRSGTQLDMFEDGGEDIYVYRAILTNEWDMDEEAAIDFYNQRGAKEKLFDQMDNDFGWHYLPKGLLKENTVLHDTYCHHTQFLCHAVANEPVQSLEGLCHNKNENLYK